MSDKQAEYLRLLQERNRLKKQMNAKSKEQLAMEELEKGFNTHFRTTQMQRTTSAVGSTAPPSIIVSNANTAIPLSVVATQPRGAAAKEKDLSPDREGGSKAVKSWRGNKGWGAHHNAGFHAMKQTDSDGDKASCEVQENTNMRGETDEYESDFDDHDSEAAVVLEQQGKQISEQPLDADVEELDMDMDMDQSLVQRISSLGAQQKQRLLSLLLHDSPLPEKVGSGSGPGPTDGPVLVPARVPTAASESVSAPIAVAVAVPAPSAAPVPGPGSGSDPVSVSNPGPRPSCVKLRILTCRDNAKMVSLRALRLRLVLPAGEFDVLLLCQLRLSSGLLPVAAALDASRLLPMLACGPDLPAADEEAGLRRVRAVSGDLLRRQAGRGTWKAALSSSAPLEIRMDLPPADRLWEIVQKAGLLPSDGQRRLYESMRLLLWNGSSGCGAARDVDVYLDSTCVFSGELSAPAPDEDLPGSPAELPPAVAVQLAGPPPPSSSSSSTAAAPVAKTPTPTTSSTAAAHSAADQDSAPPARPPAILPRPFQLESPVRGAGNLWDQDQDKPRARRGRPSRRDRDRDRGGLQSVEEAEEAAEGLGLGLGLAAAAGEREQRVRQSLEAIQQAERSNLGRLRKGSRTARPELAAGADSVATAAGLGPGPGLDPATATAQGRDRDRDREDDILDDSLEQTASSPEPVAAAAAAPAAEKASSSSSSLGGSVGGDEERSQTGGPGGGGGVHSDSETRARVRGEGRAAASQRRQQQQRSHRIEKVQETIQNTIADLNDIMSSLAIAKPSSNANANANANGKDKDRDRDSKPASAKGGGPSSFPSGQLLVLEILSTWGDSNYVGLNGIEIFDHCGRLCSWAAGGAKDRDRDRDRSGREAEQRSRCVRAVHSFPSDLNCLAQFQEDPCSSSSSAARDPRSAANLLDGHNFTRSDMHVWLAPHRRTLQLQLQQQEQSRRRASGSSDGEGDGEKEAATATVRAAAAEDSSEALSLLRHLRGGAQCLSEEVLAAVVVQLAAPAQLSMVRLFNYNKSRTHNQRGVRRCRLLLDGLLLFDGELRRASGQLLSLESESDVIELCADQLALQTARMLSDRINSRKQVEDEEDVLEESVLTLANLQRPRTSQGLDPADSSSSSSSSRAPAMAGAGAGADTPTLAASMSGSFGAILQQFAGLDLEPADQPRGPGAGAGTGAKAAALSAAPAPVSIPAPAAALSSDGSDSLLVHTLRLDLLSTWGDGSYVGLCGLQLLGRDAKGALLPLDPRDKQLRMAIDAQPRDLSSVGCFDDPRVLPNLLDGCNDTVDERRMWLIPFSRGGQHFLQVTLAGLGARLVGIRVWNYNKGGSDEHLLRGCKEALLSVDGKPIKRCLLRMGPGCPGIKYQQDIFLLHDHHHPAAGTATGSGSGSGLRSYISPSVRQDYEPPAYLVGLLFKFTFFDNWNDGYYLGLDRLEFLDARGEAVDLTQVAAVDAVPHSLRDVIAEGDAMADDPRTPQQLLADLTQLQTQTNSRPLPSWLCPLSRCMTHQEKVRLLQRSATAAEGAADLGSSLPANNTLFVLFHQPQHVAGIRFFNYSKTPARGVRDFSLEADGRLCFMGSLLPADKEKQHTFVASRLGSRPPPAHLGPRGSSRGQVILFTNDPKVTAAHKDLVSYCGSSEQDVLYINERQVMVRSKSMYNDCNPNPNLEGVQCDFSKRPMTGFVSS